MQPTNTSVTAQDFSSFLYTFREIKISSEISIVSQLTTVISHIISTFCDLFRTKIVVKTSTGSVSLVKDKIIHALYQSKKALVLSSKQYQIAQKLDSLVGTHIFEAPFTKQRLTHTKVSDESRKIFISFLKIPANTPSAPLVPLEEENFYVTEDAKDPIVCLQKIQHEIDELLRSSNISQAFQSKLPEWLFFLEHLLTTEVGDFFSTNGTHLSPEEAEAKKTRISSYILSLEAIRTSLSSRYSSLSWAQSFFLSKDSTSAFYETLMNMHCYLERMTIFKSCLEYTSTPSFTESLVDPKELRVIASRGGGMKGLVSSQLLFDIENEINKDLPLEQQHRIGDLADIFTGTSTGAIIAALASRGYTAKQIHTLYSNLGDKIFEGQESKITNFFLDIKRFFLKPKYERGTRCSINKKGRAYLEEQTRRWFDIPFSQTKKELAIPFCSYANDGKEKTVLITSENQKKLPIGQQYLLGDVVLASTSANTYFPNTNLMTIETLITKQSAMCLRIFPDTIPPSLRRLLKKEEIICAVDAGLTSNDPTSLVLDAYDLIHKQKSLKVLTIGTGKNPSKAVSKLLPSTNQSTLLQLPTLFSNLIIMMQNDIKARMKAYKAKGLLHSYTILNPKFTISIALDTIRPTAILAMKEAASRFVLENKKEKFRQAVEMFRLRSIEATA